MDRCTETAGPNIDVAKVVQSISAAVGEVLTKSLSPYIHRAKESTAQCSAVSQVLKQLPEFQQLLEEKMQLAVEVRQLRERLASAESSAIQLRVSELQANIPWRHDVNWGAVREPLRGMDTRSPAISPGREDSLSDDNSGSSCSDPLRALTEEDEDDWDRVFAAEAGGTLLMADNAEHHAASLTYDKLMQEGGAERFTEVDPRGIFSNPDSHSPPAGVPIVEGFDMEEEEDSTEGDESVEDEESAPSFPSHVEGDESAPSFPAHAEGLDMEEDEEGGAPSFPAQPLSAHVEVSRDSDTEDEGIVEEEEETSEEEELFEVELTPPGMTTARGFYASDVINGEIYEIGEDDEPGAEVGRYEDGVPMWDVVS